MKRLLPVFAAIFAGCTSIAPAASTPVPAIVPLLEPAAARSDASQQIQARILPRRLPCEPHSQLPEISYWNKPEVIFGSSDYVVRLHHMEAFYDVPGELGYIAEGEDFGFEALSFIITETQPHGGPPLHVHESEEAHVLLEGRVEYLVGERRFVVDGPYVARVPPNVPHTFVNRGPCPFNLIAVFPTKKITYEERGANPLVPSKQ